MGRNVCQASWTSCVAPTDRPGSMSARDQLGLALSHSPFRLMREMRGGRGSQSMFLVPRLCHDQKNLIRANMVRLNAATLGHNSIPEGSKRGFIANVVEFGLNLKGDIVLCTGCSDQCTWLNKTEKGGIYLSGMSSSTLKPRKVRCYMSSPTKCAQNVP